MSWNGVEEEVNCLDIGVKMYGLKWYGGGGELPRLYIFTRA